MVIEKNLIHKDLNMNFLEDKELKTKALYYINEFWTKTTRYQKRDKGDLLAMPNSYIVPNVGFFELMFYWDTYFCIKALMDRKGFVRGMIENYFFQIDKYGFVLNANSKKFLQVQRSQPPMLAFMVADFYKEYPEEVGFINRAYICLVKEYMFWTSSRHLTDIGLSRYCDLSLSDKNAEYESGWDMTPRFMGRCADFCPVDLNGFLYFYEVFLAQLAGKLNKNIESKEYKEKSVKRKTLINQYCFNPSADFYFDYNFKKKQLSPVKSLSPYVLMWVGLLDKHQANLMSKKISIFSSPAGLVCCDKDYGFNSMQWNYPNAWAPLQFFVVDGLEKYGFHTQAIDLAKKWLSFNLELFSKDGVFWEKYDVINKQRGLNEPRYETQPGFGWTCAVFSLFLQYVN